MNPQEETARLSARITGRVQGVCFRWETQRTANSLGVSGWVRNCRDGSVELIAEGERHRLEDLLHWLHSGPDMARVDEVSSQWAPYQNEFLSFDIRS